MKNKEVITWLIAGAFVILGMLFYICRMSVARVTNSEWEGNWMMSMGRAELRNTITLSGEQIDELELTYGSKNIFFYLSDSKDIVIKEYLRSNREEAKAAVSLNNGRAVVTGGTSRNFGIFWIGTGIGERIEVYLPDKLFQRISASVSSGNLTAQGGPRLQCRKLILKASSGNIRLEDSIRAEETDVETSSGNITLKGVEGVINVEASSGNVSIDRMRGSGNIETKSGNIRVLADDITGDLCMEASSGNIKLELPKGLQFHFAARTSSGNIKTDFNDIISFNQKGNEAEGDVGQNPVVKIEVRAQSGNVRGCRTGD